MRARRLLADLDIDAKALALDKLDEKFALEQLTHEPESAPGRAH